MADETDAPDAGSDRRGVFDVVVRPVPAEPVATFAVDPSAGDLGPAFYELEAYVRDRGRRASRPPGAISGEHPRQPRRSRSSCRSRGPVDASGRIGYRRLPACRAASVIHRGGYGSLADARRTLARWVEAAGLTPAGPLRVLYLQFGAEPELRVPGAFLVERDADFVTELQLPVG